MSDKSNYQSGVRLLMAGLHTLRVLCCNLVIPCLARGLNTFLPTPPCQVHTLLDDAYLCQEQLAPNEITLSLTHKGQADHSVAKTLRLCRPARVFAPPPSLHPALLLMLAATVLLAPPLLTWQNVGTFSLFLSNILWPCLGSLFSLLNPLSRQWACRKSKGCDSV